jgi:hypothetical protein
MHAKQLVVGTLVAMNAGSVAGVAREPQVFWAVALGALSSGALLSSPVC